MKSLMDLAKQGKPAYGAYIGDTGSCIAEMAIYAGFDYLRVDCEHTMAGQSELKSILRIAEAADVPTLVRVSTLSDITRLLDFGATGILVPDISTAEQAKMAVQLTKYAPLGQRGMSNISRKTRYGSVPFDAHLAKANDEICIAVQIESAEGIANIDEILAVEGIDVVTVGANDLSQSLGVTGKGGHPTVVAASDLVIEKALARGLYPLITASTPEQSKQWTQRGAFLQTICFDTAFLMKQFNSLLASFQG